MDSPIKTRPTFRIVEQSESSMNYEQYYDEFKEDFLNPLISIDGLMEKYPIPPYIYRRWSKMIKDEHHLTKKPVYIHSVNKVGVEGLRENQNIYQLKDCYGISKTFNGVRKYYGKYPDMDTARKVRNILYENDWDESLLPDLINEYGYTKERTLYNKAMEHYDEFKRLYTGNPPTRYVDMLKQLGINPQMYSILVTELRKENPHVKKTRYYSYDDPDKKPMLVTVQKERKRKKMRYISVQHNGSFTVNKHIGGVHKSFGSFKRLDDALNRRDELEANGWQI